MIVAILISFIAFFVIWCFDKVEDSKLFGEEVDKIIETIIAALSILMGFGWEQSFDVAVDVISEKVDKYIPKAFARLIMSFSLWALVFPAWKRYIVPTELDLGEEIKTGLGQKKRKFKDKLLKHHDQFLEGELSEMELDHAHVVMKLHRRAHHGRCIKPVKDTEKPLTHMLLTSKGLTAVPEDDETLLAKLLPDHLKEEEEDEEESKWSSVAGKLKSMFRFRKEEPEEEKPEKPGA